MKPVKDIGSGILKAAYKIVLTIASIVGAYQSIPVISGKEAVTWELLILFLVTFCLLVSMVRTLEEVLHGLINKLNELPSIPMTSTPAVSWFAGKWHERENREAAKRTQ